MGCLGPPPTSRRRVSPLTRMVRRSNAGSSTSTGPSGGIRNLVWSVDTRVKLSGQTLADSCRPRENSQELTRRKATLMTADVTPCSQPSRSCLDRGRRARQRVPVTSFLVIESLRDRPWLDHLRHRGPGQRSSDFRQRRNSVPQPSAHVSPHGRRRGTDQSRRSVAIWGYP